MSLCEFIKSIQQSQVLLLLNPGSTIPQNHSSAQLRLSSSNHLGSGAYGNVYQGTLMYFHATRERQRVQVAVKIGTMEDTLMELIVGCVLNSIPEHKTQGLVRPLAYVLSPKAPNFVAMVYPLGKPVSIDSSIVERDPLEYVLQSGSPSAVDAMNALITGVRNLHRLGFAHMDMKIDNTIYIDDPANQNEGKGLYIIDYGCAEHLTYGNFSESITCCGTIPFVSPEFLLCQAREECAEQHVEDLLRMVKTFYKAKGCFGTHAIDMLQSFAQNDRYTIKPPRKWRCDPLKHDIWSLGICLLLLARGHITPEWDGFVDSTVMPRELWNRIPSVCTLVTYVSKHVCNSRPKLCVHSRNNDALWMCSGGCGGRVKNVYKAVLQQASLRQSNSIVAATINNGIDRDDDCRGDSRDVIIRMNTWISCVRRLCLTWDPCNRSDVVTLQRVFKACFDQPCNAAAVRSEKRRHSPCSAILLSRVMHAVSSIVVQVCRKQDDLGLLPEQMHLRVNTQIMAQVNLRLPQIFNKVSKHRILCLNILATCLENSVTTFVNAIETILHNVPPHLQNCHWFNCAAGSCRKAEQIMQLVYWLFEYALSGAVCIVSRISSSVGLDHLIQGLGGKRLLYVPWNPQLYFLYPDCVNDHYIDNTVARCFRGHEKQGTHDVRHRIPNNCQQNVACKEWLSSLTTSTCFGIKVPDQKIEHCAFHATIWCILCSGSEFGRVLRNESIIPGSAT